MGEWLRPGQHIDLVGVFRPDMREAGDAVLLKSKIYCDTRAGVTKEAGDLCDLLARGIILDSDVLGDLFD